MGRLTLNVLLSFAQFEREVTGERIRDKIAASKQKGMWMGGQPPLGYDVRDRKLVINEPEAETARYIFCRYVELGSVQLLKAALDGKGLVSKRRVRTNGTPYGGKPMQRGMLHHMLQNQLYRGRIVHKGKTHPGEHEAIIDEGLWDQVQETLIANRIDRMQGGDAKAPSLLAGLLFDDRGERLVPTHAAKQGTRYRYYVSKPLITSGRRAAGRRIPAADIERLVQSELKRALMDPTTHLETLGDQPLTEQQQIVERLTAIATNWDDQTNRQKRAALLILVARIEVLADRIDIQLWQRALTEGTTPEGKAHGRSDIAHQGDGSFSQPDPTFTFSIPARLKCAGLEMRTIVNGATAGAPDPSL
jgi:hypothetical protein